MNLPRNVPEVPYRQRLTVRLTVGVIAVLLLIGVPFMLGFHRLVRQQQLRTLEEANNGLSALVVDTLRSAMLAGEPHLLDDAVRDLSEQEQVVRTILLDHDGRVRVSSDPGYDGRLLDRRADETCLVCHRTDDADSPSRTAVSVVGEDRVFRAATAIPNRPECHACHDPSAATNGILIMDLALDSADESFLAGIRGTLTLGIVMVLLTIAVLVWLLHMTVHRPLREVVSASRRVVEGDLDARAPVPSSGEFSQLSAQVNHMTDHLARSLRTVETQRRDLQEILDAVDDEIVVLDSRQRVVAANQAFRARLGATNGEIRGEHCRDVSGAHWPCASNRPDGCPVERVFRTGRLHKGIVSRTGSDGSESVIEIHASPLRRPDGVVERAVEVRRDISERRQMEGMLAHSEHLSSLGLLASGLSHEINNPLGAIATSVEGLRRRLPGMSGVSSAAAADLEGVLGLIGNEVHRGRSITHRLLRIARPAGPGRTLIDVNRVIEDIVAILSHEIKRTGIATRLELGPALPTLLGDESLVAQVVMNVTLNAIQAMADDGGELRIATSAADGYVQIEVEDNGRGIQPELAKRVFEPFFTTKPVGQGTGLGLFITHRIVTEMGGDIRVSSQPRRLTTFTVRIPRDAARSRS